MTEEKRLRANFLARRIEQANAWLRSYGEVRSPEDLTFTPSVEKWMVLVPEVQKEWDKLSKEFKEL